MSVMTTPGQSGPMRRQRLFRVRQPANGKTRDLKSLNDRRAQMRLVFHEDDVCRHVTAPIWATAPIWG